MIAWRKVPWTLWLYVVATVAQSGWLVLHVSGPNAAQVLFVPLILTWGFFLFNGVRWLWIATVVGAVLSFVSGLVIGPRTWVGIAVAAIGIGLLLAPTTRRYFASEPPAVDP